MQQHTVAALEKPRIFLTQIEGSWRSSARRIWAGAIALPTGPHHRTVGVETPAAIAQRVLELRVPPYRTRANTWRRAGETFIYATGAAFRWRDACGWWPWCSLSTREASPRVFPTTWQCLGVRSTSLAQLQRRLCSRACRRVRVVWRSSSGLRIAPEVLGRLGAPAEAARGMRARRALGALSACVLGAILRSLGVNIPCLGVNGVLPRHAEPGADALGSVCVAGMLVAAFLGSRRVNTENFRIWTIWRCNACWSDMNYENPYKQL